MQVKLREAEGENARLKTLLGFRPEPPARALVAPVVGRDPTHWRSSLIVARGRKDGVRSHQPVIAPAGLVGQIIDVAPHTSRVLQINDVDSRVSVLVQRTRVEGVLTGSLTGGLWLKWVPSDADLQVGDSLVTSGLGPVYPKGLFVGTIEGVESDPAGLFQQAQVRPAVALDRVEEVVILTP